MTSRGPFQPKTFYDCMITLHSDAESGCFTISYENGRKKLTEPLKETSTNIKKQIVF